MLSTEISTCSSKYNMSTYSKPSTSFSKLHVSCGSWADAEEDVSPSSTLNTKLPLVSKTKNFVAWKGSLPTSISGKTESSNMHFSIKDEMVSKYITSDIRLSDSDGDIRLFHYIHCDDDSSEDVKASRGIIRDGDKILCKTFGYTPQISCNDVDLVKKYIHSFSCCKVYDSEEGATLRLWFDNGGDKWRLSTHRKINAFHSRWGSSNAQSFGDMFFNALYWECNSGQLKGKILKNNNGKNNRETVFKKYCETLDKNKTYTFLVRNTKENRIVCDEADHPSIYFVGSFDRTTHFLLEGNDSGIPMPKSYSFDTVEDLVTFVSNIDSRKKQGLIVYLPNQKQVKIMNQTYLDFFNARGNEPSIKFRYLHVRKDPDMVSMLYTLYPDYIPMFETYENILTDISRSIHRSYINRYINRQFVSLPQPEFFILQACHGWHIQDRVNNKVSLEKVTSIIDSQSPTSLNKLIKPYITSNNYRKL